MLKVLRDVIHCVYWNTCRVENFGGSSSPAAAFFSRSIVRLANANAENNSGGNVCCNRVRPPSEKYSRAATSMCTTSSVLLQEKYTKKQGSRGEKMSEVD